jgi:C4-dicarboxylate-specific signal transduction histidine kinase
MGQAQAQLIAIEHSLEGLGLVAKIVRAMKEFSHPGSAEMQPINLNRAIELTVTVARSEWRHFVDLHMDFDSTLPLVPCNAGEFNQVILNLLINASHAVTDVVKKQGTGKGAITLSTKREGEWAEIRISDTGTGIPSEISGRIFDPFFTTKGVGKGRPRPCHGAFHHRQEARRQDLVRERPWQRHNVFPPPPPRTEGPGQRLKSRPTCLFPDFP